MFKYRLISFPLLLALLAAIFFWKEGGKYLFAPVAVFAAGAVLFEAARLFSRIEIKTSPIFCAACGSLLTAAYFADQFHWTSVRITPCAALCLLILSGIFTLLLMIGKKEQAVRQICGSISTCAVIGLPVYLLVILYFRTLGSVPLLFYVICVVKSMDTGGYIFGLSSAKLLPGGNHKIAPSISPKKSWEGVAGGMLLSVVVSLIFHRFIGGDILPYVWHGIVLSLLSLAGDLTESSLKRSAQVKDSANWIPGMGGVFDIFDSFLYVGYFMLISNLGR